MFGFLRYLYRCDKKSTQTSSYLMICKHDKIWYSVVAYILPLVPTSMCKLDSPFNVEQVMVGSVSSEICINTVQVAINHTNLK